MLGTNEIIILGIVFFLILPSIILPIITLIDLVRSDFKDNNNKIVWVIAIVFLPVIGSILYLLLTRNQKIIQRGA